VPQPLAGRRRASDSARLQFACAAPWSPACALHTPWAAAAACAETASEPVKIPESFSLHTGGEHRPQRHAPPQGHKRSQRKWSRPLVPTSHRARRQEPLCSPNVRSLQGCQLEPHTACPEGPTSYSERRQKPRPSRCRSQSPRPTTRVGGRDLPAEENATLCLPSPGAAG